MDAVPSDLFVLAFFFHLLCNFPQLLAWEPGHEEDVAMVTVRPNFQDSMHAGYITGLKKFTEYFTSVLCFTTPGDGPRSPPHRIRTHEDSECQSIRRNTYVAVFLCFWTEYPKCVSSSRACGSPELHRDPGHIPKSELERATREERHSHRWHYTHAHTH